MRMKQARRASKSKPLKQKHLKAAKPARGSKGRISPKALRVPEDPRLKIAKEQYELGVNCLSQHKYERAMAYFEKVLEGPAAELSERARVHMKICNERLDKKAPAWRTAEDHYNYAVALSNAGKLAEAEEHLAKALKQAPNAGHLHYARAAVLALRSDVEAALGGLKRAIELDVQNRYLARNDADFDSLCEDPRFADLVYPEKGLEN